MEPGYKPSCCLEPAVQSCLSPCVFLGLPTVFWPSSWYLRISLESVAISDVWGGGNSTAFTPLPLLSHVPNFFLGILQ